MNHVGEFIRERRVARGYTQTTFALALGASRQSINAWERGLATPSSAFCYRMAPLLQVDGDFLAILAGHAVAADAVQPGSDEAELLQRAEEFKAGLRGIPRSFWGPITAALTAAGSKLAELPAPPPDPIRQPGAAHNGPRSPHDGELSVLKHGRATAVRTRSVSAY